MDKNASGDPLKWENNILKWTSDGSDLNPNVPNSVAVGWIKDLFAIWQSAKLEVSLGREVSVVNLKIEYAGSTANDINLDNYIESVNSNKLSAVIIFDAAGGIIDKELGANAHNYVVGFATPLSNGGSYFTGGIVVLNGLFVDGDRKNSGEVTIGEFKAAALHEIGHLFNLDHTQANIEAAKRMEASDYSLTDEIPTMFPVLYTEEQLNLHADDKIALAELYPTKEYTDNFCRITGELVDVDGEGFQGADVVARALDPVYEWEDIRTIVSGVLYPAGIKNGSYILGGLVPDRKYVIGYRGIDSLFTGGSNIAPFDPPRDGVIDGIISSEITACSAGGNTVQADAAKVELEDGLLISPQQGVDSGSSDDNTDFDSTSPSGGCSLIR